MMIVLALTRAIHLGALMVMFGADSFSLILRRRSLPGGAPFPTRMNLALSAMALVCGLLWLVLLSGQIAGGISVASLRLVVDSTFFGNVFLLRVAALLGLVLASVINGRGAVIARVLLAAGCLVAVSLTSHAAASGGSFLMRAGNDALHLLGAAFWVGGLALLAPLAYGQRATPSLLLPTLSAFSSWAMAAVAVLVAAGTINAMMILWIDPQKWSPTYVTLLAVKLVLAALMVSLALANRFSLLPGIRAGETEAHENLLLSIVAELAIGLVIVVIVGFLGLLPYQK